MNKEKMCILGIHIYTTHGFPLSNYQLKNTTDESDKKVNFEKNKQNFPQFSLNINNPISWKLMLLIMLMQLLTNIMLVVVLYFK